MLIVVTVVTVVTIRLDSDCRGASETGLESAPFGEVCAANEEPAQTTCAGKTNKTNNRHSNNKKP